MNHDNHDDRLFFVEDLIRQINPDLDYVFKEASLKMEDDKSAQSKSNVDSNRIGKSNDDGGVSIYSSNDSNEHYIDEENENYSPSNLEEQNNIKINYSDKFGSRNSSLKSKKPLDLDVVSLNKVNILNDSKIQTSEDLHKDRSILNRGAQEDSQNVISENSQKFINESSKSRENKSENNIKTSGKDMNANLMYEPNVKSKFGPESQRFNVQGTPRELEEEASKEASYFSNLDPQSVQKEQKEYGKIAISIVSTKTIQANEDLKNIIEDLESQKEILVERIERYQEILDKQKETKATNGSTTKTSQRRSSIRDSYDLYRILQNKEMAVNKLENKLRHLETSHKIMVNKDGVEKEIAETNVKTDARNFKNTTLSQSMMRSHAQLRSNKLLNRRVRDFSNERSGSRFVNDLVHRINALNSNRKQSQRGVYWQ